jgi:glycosyltransferase involved in cell wall biosynthesis
MRILFLTQVLPYPLDAGPKLRSYYVLRSLARQHRVTLLSFVRDTDTPAAIQHLAQFCERIVTVPMNRSRRKDALALGRSLLSGQPFLITRDRVPEMEQQILNLVREQPLDAVHADQLWMAPYALFVQQAQPQRPLRLVLDQHNAVYMIPERMAQASRNPLARALLRREARLMRRYELDTCRRFDQVVWVTPDDLRAVRRIGQLDGPQSVIPICIDPGSVAVVEPLPVAPAVLFVGGMHWPPNAEGVSWFGREIWPLIQDRVPGARFYAVGKAPPPDMVAVPGVIAPGYVDDPEPTWQKGRAFVVPLLSGGGMRVKILDAWAHGLPVISTTIGAEGIEYRDGENILIADSPQEFARAVSCVLLDAAFAGQLGRNGRRWVEEKYEWRKVYQAWDQVYA